MQIAPALEVHGNSDLPKTAPKGKPLYDPNRKASTRP
jgi:hypothetical protein